MFVTCRCRILFRSAALAASLRSLAKLACASGVLAQACFADGMDSADHDFILNILATKVACSYDRAGTVFAGSLEARRAVIRGMVIFTFDAVDDC